MGCLLQAALALLLRAGPWDMPLPALPGGQGLVSGEINCRAVQKGPNIQALKTLAKFCFRGSDDKPPGVLLLCPEGKVKMTVAHDVCTCLQPDWKNVGYACLDPEHQSSGDQWKENNKSLRSE